MSDSKPKTSPRPGRGLRVGLALSLAVNLLVAGLFVGALLTGGGGKHDRAPGGGMRGLGATPFMMALEPEDRAALAGRMQTEAEPWHRNREELRRRFESVLEILRADSFDRAAFAAALAEARDFAAERQALGEDLLAGHLAQMGAQARADYADRLDRSLSRGPRRRED